MSVAMYLPPACFYDMMNGPTPPRKKEDTWIRDYKQQIEKEKENDPKTIFGWALKGFVK